MNSSILKQITKNQIREDITNFNVGDTIHVDLIIKEKTKDGLKSRIQGLEGVVIKKNHHGIQENFTTRYFSYGVWTERTFPLHSPNISNIKILKRGKVRRAKLYYLRNRVGKAAKIKENLKNIDK
ncbi:MAG: 50S ribosomal protein L19 [Clostridiales bacterium]|jgi:large subunit ribosomal protein L19|nr:50S ribosomal protein L19 [Clostridiales bacterium]